MLFDWLSTNYNAVQAHTKIKINLGVILVFKKLLY